MATTETYVPRLKEQYENEIRPALKDELGLSSIMQVPRIEKITLNMGVGEAKTDAKQLDAAMDELTIIAGQRPQIRKARKSVAQFKIREGMPIGAKVTLRGARMYDFLDRLVSIALPRIRDFRGLNPRSFDGRGNYSLGVREQIIFPEIDYDAIQQVRGLDVTITTSAETDEQARALLQASACRSRAPTARGGTNTTWRRQASSSSKSGPRSTRSAHTRAVTAVGGHAPCSASSAFAASACGSSRTRAASPA